MSTWTRTSEECFEPFPWRNKTVQAKCTPNEVAGECSSGVWCFGGSTFLVYLLKLKVINDGNKIHLIAECDTSEKVSVKLKKTNQSCDDSFLQWEFEGFEASYDPKPSFNVLQLIKEEVPPTRRWKQLLSFLCGPPESCSHLSAEECSGFCLLTMPPMGEISKRGDTEIILTENVEQCHHSSNTYSLRQIFSNEPGLQALMKRVRVRETGK